MLIHKYNCLFLLSQLTMKVPLVLKGLNNYLYLYFLFQILISNNGIAAVKCIRSVRRWSYEMFKNERAIRFVAMVTPEDLKANAGKMEIKNMDLIHYHMDMPLKIISSLHQVMVSYQEGTNPLPEAVMCT